MEEGSPGRGAKAKAEREAGFPIQVAQKCLEAKLEAAQGPAAARAAITADIGKLEGGIDLINRRFRAIVALSSWRQAAEKGLLQDGGFDKAMAADESRRCLQMSLGHCWV